MKLKDKVAVVTGASSGLGKAICETFVREGAKVVAVARRIERLEELAASLAGQPGEIAVYPGDVTKQETNEGMIDFAVEKFGRLDILVNNAGVADDMSPVGDLTNEQLERVFNINVYGPIYALRKAVNTFKAQGGGGVIVNTASVSGFRSVAGAAYCASKAAIVSLTKNTAFMYQPDGIRCNAVAPGYVATEISKSMGVPHEAGYARAKRTMATLPAAPGKPENVAAAVLFLASDDAAFVSGETLLVDGGWLAG